MAGTTWPTLVAGQKARAADVEAKFDWMEGDIVPMSGGNLTNGAYDLGTSTAAWRYLHLTGGIMASGATALSVQNDASIKLRNGGSVNEFSIDGTLAGNSDSAVPTEKAVKSYVDAAAGAMAALYVTATTTMQYGGYVPVAVGGSGQWILRPIKWDTKLHDPDSLLTTGSFYMYDPSVPYSQTSASLIGFTIPTTGYYKSTMHLLLQFATTTLASPQKRISVVQGIGGTSSSIGQAINTSTAYIELTTGLAVIEFTAMVQIDTTTVSGSLGNYFLSGTLNSTGAGTGGINDWYVLPGSYWMIEKVR